MIQAIPTKYGPVQFRSRLEARWAMFFDLVGIDWRYEHEGYQLPSGWYLPDFWLPKQDVWIEIKPCFDLDYERERIRYEHARNLCTDLANETRKRVLMYCGDFGFWLPDWNEYLGGMKATCFFPDGGEDFGYFPCICMDCHRIGFEFEGRSERICRHSGPEFDKGRNPDHPLIVNAVTRAANHRFDYQESRR